MKLTLQETPTADAIAVLRGGKYDGEVLFVGDDGAPIQGDAPDLTEFLREYKPRVRAMVAGRISKALRLGREPEDDIKHIYEKVKKRGENHSSVVMDDCAFQPIPDPKRRSILYCFGASGSGKSTFVKNYVTEWKKLFPAKPVIVFSRLAEDEALNALKPKRVLIDDGLGDEGITCDDFDDGSMIVFDDIDSLPPKQMEAVYAIMNDVLQVGRHKNLYACITSHLGSDYKKSRIILNEAHGIVCFPHGASAKAIGYVLESYCGLSKGDVRKVLKLPSRWVFVRKVYPPAVVYQNGCYLLSGESK